MTNDEAKFVLGAYRANGADAGDTAFQEALEQAQRDPELKQWHETQRAFDHAVAAKLAAVPAPAGLRESILAGGKIGRAGELHRPSPWWRAPAWLGVAASLLLLVAVVGFWTTRADAAAEDMTAFATDFVAGGFFLSEHGADVQQLRAWLAEQKAPLPTVLPEGFHRLRSLGCKRIDYRGREVSLICFGDGKEYHLFVARREDFPQMPARAQPEYFKRKGFAGVAWSDERNHYVAVTDDSLRALKDCMRKTVAE